MEVSARACVGGCEGGGANATRVEWHIAGWAQRNTTGGSWAVSELHRCRRKACRGLAGPVCVGGWLRRVGPRVSWRRVGPSGLPGYARYGLCFLLLAVRDGMRACA